MVDFLEDEVHPLQLLARGAEERKAEREKSPGQRLCVGYPQGYDLDDKDALAEKFAEDSPAGEKLRSTFDQRLKEWEDLKNSNPKARSKPVKSCDGAQRTVSLSKSSAFNTREIMGVFWPEKSAQEI